MHASQLAFLPTVIFIVPFLIYIYAIAYIFTTWAWYVFFFPILISIFPFFLYKKIKKIPLALLPLFIFLVLQMIPLPRTPISPKGYPAGSSVINEPAAIGLGYPFAYVKVFFGTGQTTSGAFYQFYSSSKSSSSKLTPTAIHTGDIVFLPELMIYGFFWTGLLLYSYLLFAFILLIKSGVNQEKRAKRLADKKKKLSKS